MAVVFMGITAASILLANRFAAKRPMFVGGVLRHRARRLAG